MEDKRGESIEVVSAEGPYADYPPYGVDVWADFYKAWMAAFLELVPTKADIGHRMRMIMRSSYAERWSSFWPYAGGRSRRDVPTSTIGGWIDRASLPTDPNGNPRVTQVIRRALVMAVTEELKVPPPEVVRLAGRVGMAPPDFSVVVERLARSRHAGDKVQFTEEIDKALAKTTDLLTRLPNGYPPHLRSLRMAEQLRVLKIDDLEELTKGDGLYSSRTPHGASADGLSTLGGARVVVVLGNPGGGKTTLLAAYCVNYIRDGAGLALFVRLDDLGRIAEARREASTTGALSLNDAVVSVIEAWDNWRQEPSTPRTREFLSERLVRDKDMVIAFDGLDEVALEDHRLSAVREILHLLESSCRARLIVASRVTAYISPFETANEYFVDTLNPGQLGDFVLDWFSQRSQDDPGRNAALQAVKDEHIGWLAKTPVVAGIVCYVAEEGAIESTLFGLYRQYLNRYFKRAWRPRLEQRSSLAEIDAARATAQRLAWAMSGVDSTGLGPHVWLDTTSLNALRAKTNVGAEKLLELYQRDGVLVSFGRAKDSDPMSQKVRWMHRTIHEHLAGRQLAEQLAQESDSGLSFLTQAALRPEWEVALDHLAGGLEELGILEPTVDALWTMSAEHDTPSKHLFRVGIQLLITGKSAHRQGEMVEFLIRHHEWHLLAKVKPAALLEALEQASERGRSATEISSLKQALAYVDLPEVDWRVVEVSRKVSRELDLRIGWLDDNLAWKIDPRRMFEEVLDRFDQGPYHHFPDDALLSPEDLSRLAKLIKEQLKRGNARGFLNTGWWLVRKHPSVLQEVKPVAQSLLGDAFVTERVQAWREELPVDWDAVGAEGLRHLFAATTPWGPFDVGWDLADRGLPAPPIVDDWAAAAYGLRQVEWTEEGVKKAHARLVGEGMSFDAQLFTDIEGQGSWSATPAALRRTLALMVFCANEPTVDRLQVLLKWSQSSDPSNYNSNHIHLDASWFASFLNFLPWHLLVEAGLRECNSLSALSFHSAQTVVEWTLSALGTGLRKDPSSSTITLLRRFVTMIIEPEHDPQIVQALASIMHGGTDAMEREVVEEVGDCLERRAVDVLPSDSELLVTLIYNVDRGRYIAGLLPKIYKQRKHS